MPRHRLTIPSLVASLLFAGVAACAALLGWATTLLALWGAALVGGVHYLLRVVLFERIVLPVRDGMREAEAEHRVRRGRCAGCGYDLRASPEACPECGTPRPAAGAPAASSTTAGP